MNSQQWKIEGFRNHSVFLEREIPQALLLQDRKKHGFTLIELLVVIAIISLLASMLLPSLGRAKEKAQTVTCINNLHQITIALFLYVGDNQDRYPLSQAHEIDPRTGRPNPNVVKSTRQVLGGNDPAPPLRACVLSARARPLWPYIRPSPVFRCPRDKGQSILPCLCSGKQVPSNYETIGCSYTYNAGGLTVLSGGGFRHPPLDPKNGIAGKTEDVIPNPSKFILLYEPPARIWGCGNTGPRWYQWHYARGATSFTDVRRAPPLFWSAIGFADGHSAFLNFSRSLQQNPYYPYEPTKQWVWYIPADGSGQ